MDDQPIGADPVMAVADSARKGAQLNALELGGRGEQKIVAIRVRLDEARSHFRQIASRCHPSGRTIARGSALKAPTKQVLNTAPFHPLCRRDFTGNRS